MTQVDKTNPLGFGTNSSHLASVAKDISSDEKALLNLGANQTIHFPNAPFFSASLSRVVKDVTGINKFSPAQLIPDRVISNIGKHYNPDTGIFTAPQNGKYHFDCRIAVEYPDSEEGDANILRGYATLKIGSETYVDFTSSARHSPSLMAAYKISQTAIMKAMETALCYLTPTTEERVYFFGSETISYSSFTGYQLLA